MQVDPEPVFVITYRTRALLLTSAVHVGLFLPGWAFLMYGLGIDFAVPVVDIPCAVVLFSLLNIPAAYYALWWLNGGIAVGQDALRYRVWTGRVVVIPIDTVCRVDRFSLERRVNWPLWAEHAWAVGQDNPQIVVYWATDRRIRRLALFRAGLAVDDVQRLWTYLSERCRCRTNQPRLPS